MAITSSGYDGPITEANWAIASYLAGPGVYTVGAGAGDFRVTAVANADRTVSVAAGMAYGKGVYDLSDSAVTKQLDTVASGLRWDMIVLRRNWTTNTSSIEVVKGSASEQTTFGTRNIGFGTIDDQPLALVRITAGTQTPTAIIDLRVWAFNGSLVAMNDFVRNYLNEPGTQVRIGEDLWQLGFSASGTAQWYLQARPRMYQAARTTQDAWSGWGNMAGLILPATAPSGLYHVEGRALIGVNGSNLGQAYPITKRFVGPNNASLGDWARNDHIGGVSFEVYLSDHITLAPGASVTYQINIAALTTVFSGVTRITATYVG